MQRLRDIIVTFIVTTFIICNAQIIFATIIEKDILVSYQDIKIIIDNKILKTEKEPFIYGGTTYLPVRAISEAVGKEVSWDEKTHTVRLTTPNTEIVEPAGVLLYEDNDLKIIYKGISDGIFGKKINLYIANNSSVNYTIEVDDFTANGHAINPIFSCEVPAKSKAESELTILTSALELNEISNIKEVKFVFEIFNKNNNAEKIISDKIIVNIN